ncbi:MAG TPA: glycosyltransferase, partial [Terriglobales bacterium]|nr:glycosyltransferase [Terriglobales bacterium]
DTLAYRDFVELHEAAAHELRELEAAGPVLTAWPATDELQRPFLGYVGRPIATLAIENFSAPELARAAAMPDWKTALVFSTKYEPPRGSLLDGVVWWRRAHQRWFGYHADSRPERAAELLNAQIVWSESRDGEWAAILQRQ